MSINDDYKQNINSGFSFYNYPYANWPSTGDKMTTTTANNAAEQSIAAQYNSHHQSADKVNTNCLGSNVVPKSRDYYVRIEMSVHLDKACSSYLAPKLTIYTKDFSSLSAYNLKEAVNRMIDETFASATKQLTIENDLKKVFGNDVSV